MGKTAEELRRDIELSRSDLTTDLDAIGDRVSPHRIVERRTEAARSRFRTMKESVMGTAEDVRGHAVDLRDEAGQRSASAGDAVHHATERAGEGLHHATERVQEVPGSVREGTRGNPLAAGLIAFGAGLLAASLLPESRSEREMARKLQPRLTDAARSVTGAGREMVDEMRPAVESSTGHLTEAAHRSADHLKDQAGDAAQSLGDTARHGAGNVTGAARP